MTRTKPPKNGNGSRNETRPNSCDNFPRRLPNRWWEAKRNHMDGKVGLSPLFSSPDDLWQACCEYFEWAERNPIFESKPFQHKADVQLKDIPKLRPFSQLALCRYLGITTQAWWNYKHTKGPEFAQVCTTVDDIIYEQKFSGAAVGLFNPIIISRDLGLRDGVEVSGPGGGPVQTFDLSANLKKFSTEQLELVRKLLPDDIFQEVYKGQDE